MPPAAFSTVRLPSVPAESAMPFALVVASMIPEFALTSTVAAAPMPITSAEITPELRVTVTVVAPMATPPVPVPSTRPELSSVTPSADAAPARSDSPGVGDGDVLAVDGDAVRARAGCFDGAGIAPHVDGGGADGEPIGRNGA